MKINAEYLKEGQPSRNIEVIVFYINEDVEKQTRSRTPTVEIMVRNNTTTGIGSEEIDTGSDKITIPPRLGMTTKKMRIVKIIGMNAGFMKLEVK